MIHIYAYYNSGGYKDFYIGSLGDKVVDYKYFLPLKSVYEEKVKDGFSTTVGTRHNQVNIDYAEWLKRWEDLPEIVALRSDSPEAYPKEGALAITHSGYRLIYQLVGGKYQIVVRDIEGQKDEFQRDSPFSIMLLSDAEEDFQDMDVLADYFRCHLKEFVDFCKYIFEYDVTVNALRFHFRRFVEKLNEILHSHSITVVEYRRRTARVLLMVIEDRTMLPIVCDGLRIRKDDILNLFLANGVRIGRLPEPVIQQTETNDEDNVLISRRTLENILQCLSALEKRVAQLECANNASDNGSMYVADNDSSSDNDEVVSDNEDNNSEGEELSLTKEHFGSDNILIRIFRLLFGIEQ